ncbi:hypothetical protein DICVIV_12089, partial [Dictyocaulus viviparus]
KNDFFNQRHCSDLVDVACDRNPFLPYCRTVLRRKDINPLKDPFKEKFVPVSSEEHDNTDDISIEYEEETTTKRYCPVNQYTFQTTCLPGKKLRYDLQYYDFYLVFTYDMIFIVNYINRKAFIKFLFHSIFFLLR